MPFEWKKTKGERGIVSGVLQAWLAGSVVLLTGLAVIALLVVTNKVKWETSGYGILLLLILCGYICGAVYGRRNAENRLVVSIVQSVGFAVLVIAIVACFCGIQYDAAGMSLMLIVGGAIVAGIMRRPKKKQARNTVRVKGRSMK